MELIQANAVKFLSHIRVQGRGNLLGLRVRLPERPAESPAESQEVQAH